MRGKYDRIYSTYDSAGACFGMHQALAFSIILDNIINILL
jgi:hypothetical protein